jgi:hypothetical protein
VHRPSRLLRKDIELVFRPDLKTEYERHPAGAATGINPDDFLHAHLLAVPTWQPATRDLSEMSFEVNQERKGLLVNFVRWAEAVRAALAPCWADASCPVEGCAHFGTATSVIYNEARPTHARAEWLGRGRIHAPPPPPWPLTLL